MRNTDERPRTFLQQVATSFLMARGAPPCIGICRFFAICARSAAAVDARRLPKDVLGVLVTHGLRLSARRCDTKLCVIKMDSSCVAILVMT